MKKPKPDEGGLGFWLVGPPPGITATPALLRGGQAGAVIPQLEQKFIFLAALGMRPAQLSLELPAFSAGLA